MLKKIMFAFVLLFAVAVLTITYLRRGWSNSEIQLTKNSGNKIVESLEFYYNEKGSYPGNLEVLVPKYLEHVSAPTVGSGVWVYNTKGTTYNFGVEGNNSYYSPVLYWNTRAKEWRMDTR